MKLLIAVCNSVTFGAFAFMALILLAWLIERTWRNWKFHRWENGLRARVRAARERYPDLTRKMWGERIEDLE